jgi:DNA-binding response OmpR family regulator
MSSEQRVLVNQPEQAGGAEAPTVYDDGYLRVEYDNYYVRCDGQRVSLPLKEFRILSRLARNVDRVVTSEEIWRSAWNVETPFNSLSLRVHIHRLRRTFQPFGVRIDSMVGVGYCLSRDQSASNHSHVES